MVDRNSENFCKNIDSMDAVEVFYVAGALEIISNGNLELGGVHILENETGSAGDSDQVKFFHPRK